MYELWQTTETKKISKGISEFWNGEAVEAIKILGWQRNTECRLAGNQWMKESGLSCVRFTANDAVGM